MPLIKKKENLYFNTKSLHLSCEFSHNSYNNLVVGSTTAHTCRGTKHMHMFRAFCVCVNENTLNTSQTAPS